MSKDYFSAQANLYKAFRPSYPDSLFAFLCNDIGPGGIVWDCATGNGQAAVALKRHVTTVIATDQSAAQLQNASRSDGLYYAQALAEAMPVADHSIDLITVAQALHWFDFEHFYSEVDRVLKPGGRLAAWTYSFLSVSPQLGHQLDAAVRWFYHEVVGPYWPVERRWVDAHYRSIPFPLAELKTPTFSIDVAWDLSAVLGYIGSWSAVQLYTQAQNHDPMPALVERLAPLWGDPHTIRNLSWELGLRLGQRR